MTTTTDTATWTAQGLVVQHASSDTAVIVSCPATPEDGTRLAQRLAEAMPVIETGGSTVTIEFGSDGEVCRAFVCGDSAPQLSRRIVTLLVFAHGISTDTVEAIPMNLAEFASAYARLARFVRECAAASETDESWGEFRRQAVEVQAQMESLTRTIN